MKQNDVVHDSKDVPIGYFWDQSSKAKFEDYLTSDAPKLLFKNILADHKNKTPAKFAEMVSAGILKCVSESGIKMKKKCKNRKFNEGNAPWFDKNV